jgi:calcium-translocating P-type ATPase
MSSSKKTPFSRMVLREEKMQTKLYAWHAHAVEEVLTVLSTSTEGLALGIVQKKLIKDGLNKFSEAPAPSWLFKLYNQLRSPLVFVLLLAFFVTAALEEYIDSGVILFALMIAVAVGIFQEGKASKAFAKLSQSQQKFATVIRAGHRHEINAENLVVGDIVVIQNGMQVPADLRIIQVKKLALNEAPLTGESQMVNKNADPVPVGTPLVDQINMAWMGTFVGEGQGIGVVVATGDQTAVGQLAQSIQKITDTETPLQSEMKKISRVMLLVIVVLVLLIFMIGLVQGISLHEMLLLSIAIAVASIPEGLPAAVTIILAIGMESLLKRGGLVRNLLAAETLGSTTYVLTDKTGTLTKAKMSVTKVITVEGVTSVTDEVTNFDDLSDLFDVSLAATDAYVDDSKGVVRGDSVEKAILSFANRIGIDPENDSLRSNRIDYLAFTSENRFAAGLSTLDDDFCLSVNGATEYILEKCTSVQTATGLEMLTDEVRQTLESQIDEETRQGKRLVAVAYSLVDYDEIPEENVDLVLRELTLAGILVLDDPVRPLVKSAIAGVQSAGAEVLLVTGDNPKTALSIAEQVGIVSAGDSALTGAEIAEMSDEDLLMAISNVKVFARVLPHQKLRLAQLLQMKGEIVAMTGDGINDAPALRKANIGIAIGSGTEVAKEASDLVLVNDSFETIYAAIEEGRRIISNLRKIVGYLISTSLSEVVLVGAAVVTGAAVPILPAQILWANVIEEGLMSVAFAFEKGEKGVMKRRPQDIHEEGILSREMLFFMALVITVLSILTLSLYFYVRSLGVSIEELRSVMFLSISIDSLFMAFAFRSLTTPIWKIPLRSNIFFLGSFLVSVIMLSIVLTVPFFQYLFSYTPLPMFDILLVAGFSLASLATIELCKWIFFEKR